MAALGHVGLQAVRRDIRLHTTAKALADAFHTLNCIVYFKFKTVDSGIRTFIWVVKLFISKEKKNSGRSSF